MVVVTNTKGERAVQGSCVIRFAVIIADVITRRVNGATSSLPLLLLFYRGRI